MTEKKKNHYVDNAKFLQDLDTYRKVCLAAKRAGQPNPQIPEEIGATFLAIATHLSYKPNFVNYTFREDMISDGVENCLVYMHNFNPKKSKNPFGYFTSVIFYAFVRRIQRERKHTYLRYKLIQNAIIEGDTNVSPTGEQGKYHVDGTMLNFDNVQEFIEKFDSYTEQRRARRVAPKAAKE